MCLPGVGTSSSGGNNGESTHFTDHVADERNERTYDVIKKNKIYIILYHICLIKLCFYTYSASKSAVRCLPLSSPVMTCQNSGSGDSNLAPQLRNAEGPHRRDVSASPRYSNSSASEPSWASACDKCIQEQVWVFLKLGDPSKPYFLTDFH